MIKVDDVNQLKLKTVVLFKSGIGSFQKHGCIDLKKNKSIKISFKDSVINDLLKSFSILRTQGDLQISGVSYEAKEIDQRKLLEDSDISLPRENSLSALLEQLRGIKVRLFRFDEEIIGKVLGSQYFTEAGDGEAAIEQEYLLISSEDEISSIRTLKISEITGLEILNPKMEKDLKFFLEIITGQNKQKKKDVTIFFNGEEKSDYILNFLQEVPAWKTTYRIYHEQGDELDGSNENNLKLQAWAIIDNVLDEDWENVNLILVSGLPISFIYDSYSPAWKKRPTVERITDLGVKVIQFDRRVEEESLFMEDYEEMPRKAKMKRSAEKGLFKTRPPSRGYFSGSGGVPPPPGAPAPMMDMMMPESEEIDDMRENEGVDAFQSKSEAVGGKGLAMKYKISNPVHVKRNNSSLIPLIQAELQGDIISLYDKNMNEQNPIKTLKFLNGSCALEKGPVSIYQNGIFAGEAMLPFLDEGSEGMIPFAVDQAVNIKQDVSAETMKWHEIAVEQEIYKKHFVTKKTTYNLENLSNKQKHIHLHHDKSWNYELFDSIDPSEETKSYFNFIFTIEGKEKKSIIIKERRLDSSQVSSSFLNLELIERWKLMKLIGNDEEQYLHELIALTNRKQNLSNRIYSKENRRKDIENEQARIRQNIESLRSSESELKLREKYVKKLMEQEDELDALRKDILILKKELKTISESKDDLQEKWMAKIESKKGDAQK